MKKFKIVPGLAGYWVYTLDREQWQQQLCFKNEEEAIEAIQRTTQEAPSFFDEKGKEIHEDR